ncbi:MAG: heme-binding protein [Hyphomicrobiaceae bacterium]|nr:heme-binding protein [Hyphomicrobiaceae bacterium]
MKLDIAQKIVAGTFAAARAGAMKPLAVAVLDDRGALKLVAAEDGTSLKRAEIAIGKAHGALAMGLGSRTLYTRAQQQPYFIAAVTHAVGGSLIPVPGGVLILDAAKSVIGAIGVSGDTSDNDEMAALAGIGAAGLTGDPGA